MRDEEGYLLPLTIYGWPDITALTGSPDGASVTILRFSATGP